MSEVTKILPNLNSYTLLPATLKQFESLTNELLVHMNERVAPNAMDPKAFALIVIRAVHSLDGKSEKVRKDELLAVCHVKISRELTSNIGEGIVAEIKATTAEVKEVLPDEVTGIPASEPPPESIATA